MFETFKDLFGICCETFTNSYVIFKVQQIVSSQLNQIINKRLKITL
jgi:hypothetical protein